MSDNASLMDVPPYAVRGVKQGTIEASLLAELWNDPDQWRWRVDAMDTGMGGYLEHANGTQIRKEPAREIYKVVFPDFEEVRLSNEALIAVTWVCNWEAGRVRQR